MIYPPSTINQFNGGSSNQLNNLEETKEYGGRKVPRRMIGPCIPELRVGSAFEIVYGSRQKFRQAHNHAQDTHYNSDPGDH